MHLGEARVHLDEEHTYIRTVLVAHIHTWDGPTYLDEANTPGYTPYVHNTGNMGKAQHVHVHVHVHIHMHACMRTPTLMAIWGSVLINIDSEHMSIPNNCTIRRLCTDLIAMYNNCHFGVYRQCR